MDPINWAFGLDGAMVAVIMFAIFFGWLVFFHLRKEDKREGYPTMRPDGAVPFRGGKGFTPMPREKEFRRPHGRSTVVTPRPDPRAGNRPAYMPHDSGRPLTPQRDGLIEGLGPAAWAERSDEADLNVVGEPKLSPLSRSPQYSILEGCPDPRGWPVFGSDWEEVGRVRDVWFNRAEFFPRYLEVEAPTGDFIVPIFFAVVKTKWQKVFVRNMPSERLAKAPFRRHEDRLTLLEEDRINAYFAGGRLFGSTPRGENAA